MTRLFYEVPTGRVSVEIPPAFPPSAGDNGGLSGDSEGSRLSPLPLCSAYKQLCWLIDQVPMRRDGVWYCEELRH